MADVNLSRVYQTPNAPVGSNPKSPPTHVKETAVVRELPVLTDFNTETGLIEPRENWDGTEASSEAEVVKTKKEPARHQKWKEEQNAKKEQRQQAKTEKAMSQQLLAKDFLQKGDLFSAAKALGTTPQELVQLINNASLSVPTKGAELTPEQKKTQQEEQLRQARDQEINELKQWKFEQTATNWIKENIDPVLSDKTKFELLNQGDTAKIKRGVYDYLNQHYAETCEYNAEGKLVKEGEILSIQDTLETLEQQYEQAAMAALEKTKGLKKFSKYFAPSAEEVEEPADEELQNNDTSIPAPGFRTAASITSEEEEDDLDMPAAPLVRRTSFIKSKKPFALMNTQEKMAFLRSGG